MSESSREKAGQVKEQLYWSKWHLDNARRIVESVPDIGLKHKIEEAGKQVREAHEHVVKKLDEK